MKKIISILLCAVIGAGALAGCSGGGVKKMQVDFASKDGSGVQNVKKYDGFASTWAWLDFVSGTIDKNALGQISGLSEMLAESMRVDLFMGEGGIGKEIGKGGKKGTTDEEFAMTMQLFEALQSEGIDPYVIYLANPQYSQNPLAPTWKSVPEADKWEEICANIAAYYKRNGINVAGHEIWNEPDLLNFFAGSWSDYIDTYIAGARGIRSADSEAVVGGISAANMLPIVTRAKTAAGESVAKTDLERFVERAAAVGQLPDFISWHYFGRDTEINSQIDETQRFGYLTQSIRDSLSAMQDGTSNLDGAYPELETLQQHVNEFNIFEPYVDPVYTTQAMLPGVFHALESLNAATDLTSVAWAAFMGNRSEDLNVDLVNSISFERYAAYYALWMYARLPVDKVVAQPGIEGVGAMAGCDSQRAGLILYNEDDKDRTVEIALDNIPFNKGDLTVYITDKDSATYITENAPKILYRKKDVATKGLKAKVKLSANAACYVEVNGEAGKSEAETVKAVGNFVRADYWYPDRGDNKPYSDFLRRSSMAHLGMAEENSGKSAVSALLSGLKDSAPLTMKYETWGELLMTEESAAGFKIDYETNEGFVKSVYYALEGAEYDLVLPFGKKGKADETVTLNGASGTVAINLQEKAPSGWTGRIRVNYLIQDMGKGAAFKFRFV